MLYGGYFPWTRWLLADKACTIAKAAHEGQTYGVEPYIRHCTQVATVVQNYGESYVVVALLHDVVEDTSITRTELHQTIGELLASVDLLTDEPGASRKERKRKTYDKWFAARNNPDPLVSIASTVKIADRIVNVRHCLEEGPKDLLKMYLKEHEDFRTAVYMDYVAEPEKAQLEHLIWQGKKVIK